ncbi:MAG: efflux RND transporter periplasmic adaptor subunit [Bacteroidetes bacterium]|nr:MAG: efflux RND transporter periplasmic adaptor subunit [Bacteroidota bacterium]
MKTILKITFFMAVSLFFIHCSSTDGANEQTSATRTAQSVKVLPLQYSEIPRDVTYTAHLKAYREVHLTTSLPGSIEKIHVDVSQNVSQGQLLVEMDKNQLRQARLQFNNLEADYHRLDTLNKLGSVAPQQYAQMRTQYEQAKVNLEFLKENTMLMAPFNGVVSGKFFENGEMFSGAPNTPSGKAAILSLIQTHQLIATVSVAERFYPSISIGMQVFVSTDVYPNETFSGTISKIFPEIDPQTRSFKTEILIPNNDQRLRPGMFARARIEMNHVNAFVVPAMAVLKLQGSNERFVYLENQGKAQRVVVELGDRYDDKVEVISDQIKTGGRLIIAGQSGLIDGAFVMVQE